MKNLTYMILGVWLLSSSPAGAVEKTDSWDQVFPVSGNAPRLVVHNVWGDVRVNASSAGEIRMAVAERRWAPTQALFERSLEVLPLLLEADDNSVSLMLGGQDRWQRSNPCRGCRVDLDIEVWVPADAQIEVRTVNDGQVRVDGVEGLVSASNVNGPVFVSGARDCGRVKSINGQLDLTLTGSPGQACEVETINGDITIALPTGSGMDLAVDLFNGSVHSEFEIEPVALEPSVKKTRDGKRVRYKINQAGGLRIGAGGPVFSVKSLNGDIAIKEI